MYKVEKGIEIPPRSRGGSQYSSQPKYPWGKMEVGDSFFVPVNEQNYNIIVNRIRAAVAKQNGRYGEFTTRKVSGGVRVWRTA